MERGGFREKGPAFGGDGRRRGRSYGQRQQQQEQYHQQGRGTSRGITQGHVGPSHGGRGGGEGPRRGGYYGGGGVGRGGEGRGFWESGRGWGPGSPGQPHSQRPTAETLRASVAPSFQSMKISGDLASPSSPPVMQPGDRTNTVRYLRLRTNHFSVNYNQETMIRHYNVDVKQEVFV